MIAVKRIVFKSMLILIVSATFAVADSLQSEGYDYASNRANGSGQSFTVSGTGDYYLQSFRFQSAGASGSAAEYAARYLKIVADYGGANTILGVSDFNPGPILDGNYVFSENLVYNFASVQLAKGTTYTILGSDTDSTTSLDTAGVRLTIDGADNYSGGNFIGNTGWDAEFEALYTSDDWNQKLTLTNSGFDADAIAAGSLSNLSGTTPTGWTWNGTGTRGTWRNSETTIGIHASGMANGAQLSQTLSETLAADTRYLLSAYVYFGTSTTAQSTDWSIGLYADGTLLGEIDESYNSLVPNMNAILGGSNVGPALLSLEIDPSLVGGVSAGDSLEVRMINNSTTTFVHPDEVNVYAIPEPASLGLLGLMGVVYLLRRRLLKA